MSSTIPSETDAGRDDASKRRWSWCLLLLIGLVVVAIGVAVFRANPPDEPDVEALLAQANSAFEDRDFETARRRADEVLAREPENPAALLLLGKCLESKGLVESAARQYAQVPAGRPPHSTEAACRRGLILWLKFRRFAEAERWYLRALEEDRHSLDANTGLTILWGFSRQWWRQIPSGLAMIRAGRFERVHLYSLALAEIAEDATLDFEIVRRDASDDPLVQLAIARRAMEEQRYAAAVAALQDVLRNDPDLTQARVWLGEIYFELGQTADFAAWSRNLPPAAERHPTTWVLRGKWAQQHSTPESALRCFCEAVERNPNQTDALYQAGRILTAMKRDDDAEPFLQRARTLQEYVNAAKAADTDRNLQATQRAAKLAETLGNTWEAYGWATLAASHPEKPRKAHETVSRLKSRIGSLPLERTEARFNPATRLPFRSLPLPSITGPGAGSVAKTPAGTAPGRFSFADRTAEAGISFQYFNGTTTAAKGTKYMQEVMGGGVAVLDFNGDGRPDLYFTQGCRWPVDDTNFEHLDRVYLNRGDDGFLDVTGFCGIRENGFSQGVAVGDFDSDGFPDLLIGNVGRNRLYRNNGDGTFTDVSLEAGLTRSDWTTSCAVADLTGDGHPELYVVNYLQGPDVFTRTCGPNKDSVCQPQHFEGANDRLHWNRGDGRFRDVTETSGIVRSGGKGLGVVVASFGGSKLPNVFVANDTVANFYFENQTPDRTAEPEFRDAAMIRGLALSDRGRAQACMGVAAGDADGDGETELLVTNFHAESNAYYKFENGLFRDAAATSGLRQPSLMKLGFGTQFLDADLDGWLDLIVANGHIDNFSSDGRTEYQMQPQFFANVDNGRFREVESAALGGYFQRKVLGRGLARLDWNGDGREDAVVSHLDAPAVLLENTAKDAGGFLALRLHGGQSNRDAVGAVVRVETKNRRLTRQLTAGDGFHASNERILIFGLGGDDVVEKLTVRWPSGRQEEFTQLPANSRWIAVESAGRLYSAPTPQAASQSTASEP